MVLLISIITIHLVTPMWICLRESIVFHLTYCMVLLGLGYHSVSVGSGCQYCVLFFLRRVAVG